MVGCPSQTQGAEYGRSGNLECLGVKGVRQPAFSPHASLCSEWVQRGSRSSRPTGKAAEHAGRDSSAKVKVNVPLAEA